MHDPCYDTYVALVNNNQWDDIYVPMNEGNQGELYTTMPEEEGEEIYQNTVEITSQFQNDDYFASSTRGKKSVLSRFAE